MSINNLVIRGSTNISLHERFTSLRRGGGPSQAQENDSLNQSGYNRAGYASAGGDTGYRDTSPGPAFRGPGGCQITQHKTNMTGIIHIEAEVHNPHLRTNVTIPNR